MIAASDVNSAVGLDLADGVLDGNFFGTKIGVSSAPVYKTPTFGTTSSLGLLGATSALTLGSYPTPSFSTTTIPAPTFSAFTASAYSAPTLTSLPTTSYVGTYTEAATTLPPAYSMPVYPTVAPTVTSTVYPSVVRPAYPVLPTVMQSYVQQVQCVPQVVLPTTTVEYQVVTAPPPVQVQYIQAPPEIRYVQSPPEIRYVQSPPEIRYIEAPAKPAPEPVEPVEDPRIKEYEIEIEDLKRKLAEMSQLRIHIAELEQRLQSGQLSEGRWEEQRIAFQTQIARMEEELQFLRRARQELMDELARLRAAYQALQAEKARWEEEMARMRTLLAQKQEVRSQTNMTETYKVKTFELAAKLAIMDGTDDGLYNGLPIEVEGEGLYRDLVKQGRKPKGEVTTGQTSSMTTSKETYKVKSFEMAEKLSKMDGTNDGLYNGLPIEVVGEGLYRDLVAAGRKSTAVVSTSGGAVKTGSTSSTTGTYKVTSYEIAEKLSKMDGHDEGLYNGLPIEVAGQGLFRDLRAQRAAPSS